MEQYGHHSQLELRGSHATNFGYWFIAGSPMACYSWPRLLAFVSSTTRQLKSLSPQSCRSLGLQARAQFARDAQARTDVLFRHSAHALFAHTNAARHQFLPHLGSAVFLFDLSADGPDVSQQGFIADALVGARLGWLVSAIATHVRKVPAGTDIKQVICHGNRPVPFVACDPGILHDDCLAKYAVAFFIRDCPLAHQCAPESP
jgi:hypothetical protein